SIVYVLSTSTPHTMLLIEVHSASLPPASFLLILRPPPPSTLFPYTTLFRSAPRRTAASPSQQPRHLPQQRPAELGRQAEEGAERSEEHTSELQSRSDLVCRLLLEKKKNKKLT